MNPEQTQARLRELANEAAAIFDRADAEGRELTKEERTEVEHKMARARISRRRCRSRTWPAASAAASPTATAPGSPCRVTPERRS
jgi:hypothetical protein